MTEASAPPATCSTLAAPLAAYANYCEVGHNAFEFIFDFGQFRPEQGAVQIHSRIVTGPVQAKVFARMFATAIDRFEECNGSIADLDDEDALSALIGSVPDFERRAANVRARPAAPSSPGTPPSPPDVSASPAHPGAPAPYSQR